MSKYKKLKKPIQKFQPNCRDVFVELNFLRLTRQIMFFFRFFEHLQSLAA